VLFKIKIFLAVTIFIWMAIFITSSAEISINKTQLREKNQKHEAQMKRLAKELRCMVCQNESLESSQAGLAKDLRRELRKQIISGKTDEQIKTYMVERYGEFILYRPRFNTSTWFLWISPLVFLFFGILILALYIKKRNLLIKNNLSNNQNPNSNLQKLKTKRAQLEKILSNSK